MLIQKQLKFGWQSKKLDANNNAESMFVLTNLEKIKKTR